MTSPRLLFIHALSPLHAGTGQSAGAVDLAIARDRATQHPVLPGSSLKGALRDAYRSVLSGDQEPKLHQLFGPPTEQASDHAGALVVGDGNLLLFPVRSVAGTFAWITSPYLLRRLARDVEATGGIPLFAQLPSAQSVEQCFVSNASILCIGNGTKGQAPRVVLEDLDLKPTSADQIDTLADALGQQIFPSGTQDCVDWQTMLKQRLCLVHDDVLSFLSEHATEVVARVALENDSKTVRQGGLWNEEHLPTETVLVSLLHAQTVQRVPAADLLRIAAGHLPKTIQLGGKATVGRGRCRLVLTGASS